MEIQSWVVTLVTVLSTNIMHTAHNGVTTLDPSHCCGSWMLTTISLVPRPSMRTPRWKNRKRVSGNGLTTAQHSFAGMCVELIQVH